MSRRRNRRLSKTKKLNGDVEPVSNQKSTGETVGELKPLESNVPAGKGPSQPRVEDEEMVGDIPDARYANHGKPRELKPVEDKEPTKGPMLVRD